MALARTRPAPPVRAIHLGLGAFFRAHQAWYTQRANAARPEEPFGIAAFTGRRPDAATVLSAQDSLYHVLIRGSDGDTTELVECLSGSFSGSDNDAWERCWSDPAVGWLTSTVTEAGYLPDSTVTARLVSGLDIRRRSEAGPIAIVPCDNLVDNGETVRRVVLELAHRISTGLSDWIEQNVSFVSTVVDRITPATTDDDVATVRSLSGEGDASPVVTEPFTEWALAGEFPLGRPSWEAAGARFVNDVRPFEQRKLWLLNGSHSLLAYAAPTRGHRTVAEAVDDPVCQGWIEQWWDEACRHLPFSTDELAQYRADLLARYANPRIRHELRQIAMDGSQKLPIRVLPVLARERANGVLPGGAVIALAGWLAHLRDGSDVRDPRASELVEAVGGSPDAAARRMLQLLDASLADDAELVHEIGETERSLASG